MNSTRAIIPRCRETPICKLTKDPVLIHLTSRMCALTFAAYCTTLRSGEIEIHSNSDQHLYDIQMFSPGLFLHNEDNNCQKALPVRRH